MATSNVTLNNSNKRGRQGEKHVFSDPSYAGDMERVKQWQQNDERQSRKARQLQSLEQGTTQDAEGEKEIIPGNKDEQKSGFFACQHTKDGKVEQEGNRHGHAQINLNNCPICLMQIVDPNALNPPSSIKESLYI